MCTHDRKCLFGRVVNGEMRLNDIGRIVREEWNNIPTVRPEIEVDEYVVMPNHLHGIVIINDSTEPHVGAIHESPLRRRRIDERRQMTLSKIIGRFKMNSAKGINLLRGTTGLPVWQRGFYDHIIRNEADLDRIRRYVGSNPLQWTIDEENPERLVRTTRPAKR
jgi:REP-associated tyrosine transposase